MDALRWFSQHPTITLAIKAGTAAGAAFFLGSLLPAPLDEYKYYAALGAYTVIGLVVVESIKESLRVLGAVLIGVAVAVATQLIVWTNPATVASAVLICVLLAALPMLGEQRSWAPLAALFVLATGGPDPEPMALGYLIQLPLGALVGIVVNFLVFAPLGSRDVEQVAARVRVLIASHPRFYADLLDEQVEDPGDGDAVSQRTDQITAHLHELERGQASLLAAMAKGQQARRGNPRARAWVDWEDSARGQAEATSRCAAALGAVAVILRETAPSDQESGQHLRRDAAHVLRGAAEIFEDPHAVHRDQDKLATTQEGLDRMMQAVRPVDTGGGLDSVLFAALALSVQQCLTVFTQDIVDSD